jgi:hypothetical protein
VGNSEVAVGTTIADRAPGVKKGGSQKSNGKSKLKFYLTSTAILMGGDFTL